MMSLDEVRNAFASVYGATPENPPFELIGFDACLMGTLETANIVANYARYMIGSEENEPGSGWNFFDFSWLRNLFQNIIRNLFKGWNLNFSL